MRKEKKSDISKAKTNWYDIECNTNAEDYYILRLIKMQCEFIIVSIDCIKKKSPEIFDDECYFYWYFLQQLINAQGMIASLLWKKYRSKKYWVPRCSLTELPEASLSTVSKKSIRNTFEHYGEIIWEASLIADITILNTEQRKEDKNYLISQLSSLSVSDHDFFRVFDVDTLTLYVSVRSEYKSVKDKPDESGKFEVNFINLNDLYNNVATLKSDVSKSLEDLKQDLDYFSLW